MVFPRVDSALPEYGIAVVRRYDRWNTIVEMKSCFSLILQDTNFITASTLISSAGHYHRHLFLDDWMSERCARYEWPHPRSLKIFGTLLSLKSRKSLQSRAYRSHDVFIIILLIWSWFRSLLQKRNAVSHFGRSMWNQVSSSWSDHN